MTEHSIRVSLRDAAKAIDRKGELPLSVRNRLKLEVKRLFGDDASFARAWMSLQLACAKRSRLIWRSHFRNEPEPVQFAVDLFDGAITPSDGISRLEQIRATLDGKFERGESVFPGIYSGFAGWAAARDILFGPRKIANVTSERELDPLEWEACFLASIAEAGSATWEEHGGDAEQRRAFWEWYLNDALPEAVRLSIP